MTAATVLVVGEAGIGKTTLLRAVADDAAEHGLVVRHMACVPDADAVAFAPWAELLTAHLAAVPARRRAAVIGPAAGDLASVAPSAIPGRTRRPRDTPTARVALFNRSAGSWPASGRFARRCTSSTTCTGLTWHRSCCWRTWPWAGRGPSPGWPRRGAWARTSATSGPACSEELGRSSTRVELAGLDPAAVRAMVAAAGLGGGAGPRGRADGEDEGQPVLPHGAATGSSPPGGALDAARLPAANEVPWHVGEVVQRRMARVPSPVADLLGVAAVVGADGGLDLLAGAARLDRSVVLDRIAVAESAGLLERDGRTRWRFSHDLVRDAVQQGLAAGTRARLYERVLRSLPRGVGPAYWPATPWPLSPWSMPARRRPWRSWPVRTPATASPTRRRRRGSSRR